MISDFQLNYDRGNIEDRKFIIKDKIIEMINKENIAYQKCDCRNKSSLWNR